MKSCGLLTLFAAAALVAGCGSDDTSAPATTTASSATTETTSAPTTTAAQADTAISGNGLCVDIASAGVRDALAALPDGPWAAEHASDAPLGKCPQLLWVSASGGNSSGAPISVLLFHDGQYVGTATSEPYAFAAVSGSTDTSVAVDYKWLVGDEPFCCPAGGPATIHYSWDGSKIVMDHPLPKEVTG